MLFQSMRPNHQKRLESFRKAGLYLVVSSEHSAGRDAETVVVAALEAGVRLVQLREKNMHDRALFEAAVRMRGLTDACKALLIINDRLDIALAVGADGVHLGQDDLPVSAARRLAPDMIVGASTHNLAEALAAQDEGASYVNIGPLFPTGTKVWAGEFLDFEGLRRIAPSLRIPYTVMGGIKRHHIPDLRAAGVQTVAVVTAVTAAADPGSAAGEMLAALRTNSGQGGGR